MVEEARRLATPFGDTVRWITGEHDTAGAYSLHERIAPPGAASTVHSHSKLIESFYVLEGTFAFEINGESVSGTRGAFVSAPRGAAHAWRVIGSTPARALIIFAPSAKLAYFEEVDAIMRAANGGTPDAGAAARAREALRLAVTGRGVYTVNTPVIREWCQGDYDAPTTHRRTAQESC
jgi:quercetin dioxygenase-like cupin family protein